MIQRVSDRPAARRRQKVILGAAAALLLCLGGACDEDGRAPLNGDAGPDTEVGAGDGPRADATTADGTTADTTTADASTVDSAPPLPDVDCDEEATRCVDDTAGPFQEYATITAALNDAVPGDTVVVKGGRYHEELVLPAGTASQRLVLRNYPGERPVLTGAVELGGWSKCSSKSECGGNDNWQKMYFTTIPGAVIAGLGYHPALMLNPYQGDQMISFSQWPNPTDPALRTIMGEYASADASSTGYIQHSKLSTFSSGDLAGAYVFAHVDHMSGSTELRNRLGYDQIDSVSGNRITFSEPSYPGKWTSVGKAFSIVNSIHSAVLDRQGEYYFDDATDKLYVWPHTDPATQPITITVLHHALELSDYTTVQGFEIREYSVSSFGDAPVKAKAHDVVLEDNHLSHCFGFHNSQAAANVYGDDNVIEGNVIVNGIMLRGIAVSGSGVRVVGNRIDKVSSTGIKTSVLQNSLIADNTITDVRCIHANGISCYGSSGKDARNVTISGNRIIRSTRSIAIQRTTDSLIINNILDGEDVIYPIFASWGNVRDVLVANNVIVGDSRDCAVEMHSDNNAYTFKNNIIEGTALHPSSSPSGYSGDLVHSHNIFTAGCTNGWFTAFDEYNGVGTNERDISDLASIFVDPANRDWHLRQGSPAIDEGTDLSSEGFAVDIDGTPRPALNGWDIGPYEYH